MTFLLQVIFVDADQVVRADMGELYDMDIKGRPLAYTPFCDNNKDMDGYRFWRQVDNFVFVSLFCFCFTLFLVWPGFFCCSFLVQVLTFFFQNPSDFLCAFASPYGAKTT